MESYDELVEKQQERADQINLSYTLFKKLPKARRTVDTVGKSSDDLESIWQAFFEAHKKLEQLPNYKESEYYESNFAYNTQRVYKSYKTKIEEFLAVAKGQELQGNEPQKKPTESRQNDSPVGKSSSAEDNTPLNLSIQTELAKKRRKLCERKKS